MMLNERRRLAMVREQLIARGLKDVRVLKAMSEVPRERFVAIEQEARAYSDFPLPIGFGQTISQPYIVAFTCQLLALTGNETVLEVGSGSGYQAAVLSRLARWVVGVEIIEELAERSKQVLRDLGYINVKIVVGNGRNGHEPRAPYEAIVAAATSRDVPLAWKKQLRAGGRMVMPQQTWWDQRLVRFTKVAGRMTKEQFGKVMFVPLVS